MTDEAASAGFFTSKHFGKFPRIQILTIEELLAGKKVQMPQTLERTFKQAEMIKDESDQVVSRLRDRFKTKMGCMGLVKALPERPPAALPLYLRKSYAFPMIGKYFRGYAATSPTLWISWKSSGIAAHPFLSACWKSRAFPQIGGLSPEAANSSFIFYTVVRQTIVGGGDGREFVEDIGRA